MPLPSLPVVAFRQNQDLSPQQQAGFLKLRRLELCIERGGEQSEPFVYDCIDRRALDAVVLAPYHRRDEQVFVWLRSAIRPPVALRPEPAQPVRDSDTLGQLWELPAGLVEPDECSAEGLLRCASRELEEEIGFAMDVNCFVPLGPAVFPAPGIIGERHHYFRVEVQPSVRTTPSEDGSVLETDAQVVAIALDEALALVRAGVLEDAKSEIALRRLAEVV